MVIGLPLIFASASASNLQDQQEPLRSTHGNSQGNSFIANSIFRPNPFSASSIPEPETLLPAYFSSLSSSSLSSSSSSSYSSEFQTSELYQGINTFAHLPFVDCLSKEEGEEGDFDIGIIGHPFDLGVSYRPGARFGPNGARQGARRMSGAGGWE